LQYGYRADLGRDLLEGILGSQRDPDEGQIVDLFFPRDLDDQSSAENPRVPSQDFTLCEEGHCIAQHGGVKFGLQPGRNDIDREKCGKGTAIGHARKKLIS
jgi:hypothetical protein